MPHQLLSSGEFAQVLRLAALERSGMPQGSISQLATLLKHFSNVQELPHATSDGKPNAVATLREDKERQPMSRDALLRLAPESENGYIKIRPAM